MHAIEFRANIKNGTIKIPKEYQAQLINECRVIILQGESSVSIGPRKKRRLTALQITTKDLKFDRDEANER